MAYNFVYRAPRAANEWQLWFFASRDPDIARTLARHFFWNEAILFKEELAGVRAAVALAADDQIVHAEEVRRYLTGEDAPTPRWERDGLEVLWFPKLDHAVVFEAKRDWMALVDVVQKFCKGRAAVEENGHADGGHMQGDQTLI